MGKIEDWKTGTTVQAVWKKKIDKKYHCTECGASPWYNGNIMTQKYCFNCGARMVGKE